MMMAGQSSPAVSANSIVRSGPRPPLAAVDVGSPIGQRRHLTRLKAGENVRQAVAAQFGNEDIVREAVRRAKVEPPAKDERAIAVAQHQVARRKCDIEVAVRIQIADTERIYAKIGGRAHDRGAELQSVPEPYQQAVGSVGAGGRHDVEIAVGIHVRRSLSIRTPASTGTCRGHAAGAIATPDVTLAGTPRPYRKA